jgi:hypothetical protein
MNFTGISDLNEMKELFDTWSSEIQEHNLDCIK